MAVPLGKVRASTNSGRTDGQRSADHWEPEVGDLIALDVGRRVAERHVLNGGVPEEAPAAAHDDGHQVDRNLVEQPVLETLTGDHAGGHVDSAVAGDLLSPGDRRLDTVRDEGERRTRMRIHPLGRNIVRYHDDR